MENKIVSVIRIICSIGIVIFCIDLFNKIQINRFICIPFLICSFAILGKNIFILTQNEKYIRIFNKIFVLSLLLFAFGFIIYWCYKCFMNKEYISLLLSLPFWIFGIILLKKNFFK